VLSSAGSAPRRGRPREEGAARAAILAAADGLFYQRGLARVSLASVAGAAGVSRRTLYYHFADKEALVRAYLRDRDRSGRALFERAEARAVTVTGSILAVFESLETWFRTKEFRGCAFVNAVGEGGETVVFAGPIARRHKVALRDWFVRMCTGGGAADAGALGEQLMILFDGAMCGSSIRRDPAIARQAREAARTLLAARDLR
jgi:AcrR family transcriptional regulator